MHADSLISRRAQVIYIGALLGFVFSKGMALFPAYALDDYAALYLDRDPMFYLAQGRYTQAAIQILLTRMGISATAITFPVVMLFLAFGTAAIAAGILFCTRRQGPLMLQAGIAATIGAHPYLTEYFTFRESLITQSTSFALLYTFFYVALKTSSGARDLDGRVGFALAFSVLVILAGAQQTTFLTAMFFILTRIFVDISSSDGEHPFKEALSKNSRVLLVVFFAGIAYVFLFSLSRHIAGSHIDDRATLIGLQDLSPRILAVQALIKKILFLDEPVLSSVIKIVLLLTTLCFIVSAGIHKPRVAIGSLLLFATLLFGSIFLVSVSKVWWAVPRAIYGVGFAFGLTFVALSLWAKRWQRMLFSMLCVAALGLSFHSSAVLHDQIRLNRWDLWTAGAIAQDLAALDIGLNKKVTLVGAAWKRPIGPKTNDGDLNTSAIPVPGSARYLMKEATGLDREVESVASDPACLHSEYWPSRNSIHVESTGVVVCMGSR